MYYIIAIHSVFRYLLLIVLLVTIYLAWEGRLLNRKYTKTNRILAGATSGISHIQLLLGFSLYIQSPVAQGFWTQKSFQWSDNLFFGFVHFTLMSVAIIVITIGAALAKRETDDKKRFKIIFQYFIFALVIILIAIPWPFSPLAQRPFIREF
jgi:cytochrome bd-type quinol oxidase subunit 2